MDQYNTLREKIERGNVVLGARCRTFSPSVIEVYGELGLDFVWLDFEHGGPSPYDSTVFENLTRAAEISGTELFVRLPSGDPPLVRKVLDTGVRNVLIPRLDSAAEVREVVEATRFKYDGGPGERGKASERASTWGSVENYIETEDENVCLGVMVEKTTAVNELADIVEIPELGFVFVGPSDLSVQMGHYGNRDHPDVGAKIKEITDVCREAGVPIGSIANDPADAASAIEDGHQILRIGGEVAAARTVLSERLRQIGNDKRHINH